MTSDPFERTTITLEQFIIDRQTHFPFATGEFSQIMQDLCLAAKIVNREVNRAGLVDILGAAGKTNVQGEKVQKLDVFADKYFIDALSRGGQVCVIGSEEHEEIIPVENPCAGDAKYVVLIDPLDGSSNIDANVSIGTIFSIFRRTSPAGPPTLEDCLQPGTEQVAAGYIVYGSSTMFVYTTGHGVNGFTLDPSIGEFFLSHKNMQIPESGACYSVNEGNSIHFSDGLLNYLDYVKGMENDAGKPYSARYIGSLVADFHRNLLKGGIFMYPGTTKKPNGKLRLLYEANPMAFLIEQAGGMATDGKQNITDIVPEELHQRTPLFIGSKKNVSKLMEFLAEESVEKKTELIK